MTQGKRTNYFFEEKSGSNDVYEFNQSHPSCQEVRNYFSKLLEHHWNYCADNHFQQDAVENPQQGWWEMYLPNPKIGLRQLVHGFDLCVF